MIVTPPPIQEPLRIDPAGRITSPAWVMWLQNLIGLSTTGGITTTGNPNGIFIKHLELTDVLQADDTSNDGTLEKHVTDALVKKYNDHILLVNSNPHGTDHSQLDAIGVLDPTSTDSVKDKHLSNAQGKVWQDRTVNLQADLLDPTGWIDPTAIIVDYNSAADTVTLTGTLDYYWRGEKRSLASPWTSTAHSATTGQSYFLSSADGTTFTWSTTPWLFSDMQVAFVQHGATDLFCVREVHGCNTPWSLHEQNHIARGTFRQSGGDLSSYVLASTTVGDRRPTVSACIVHDEDLESTITALSTDIYNNVTLTTTGVSTFNTVATEIVPVLANNPYYNSYTAPNWTQTLMANNSYMSVWLVAVPVANDIDSQKYRFLWLQGQSNGNLTTQQALTPSDLNLGSLSALSPEYVFIAKIIIRFQGGNWEFTSVTSLSGSRSLYTGVVAGFLSTVATDATLTGDGTVGNPLHVVASGGGSGDVVGPASAINSNFASFDTTTGKLIKDSGSKPSDFQATLVSGTNIKTVNGTSLVGAGDVTVSGSAAITQVEVDFGATAVWDKTFAITDATVSGTSKIMAHAVALATTDNDADEIAMSGVMAIASTPSAGAFDLSIMANDGPISGKFLVNYLVG